MKRALERDRTIDITTTGRKTGLPRRTEIWFHNLDGSLYITGTPGPRDWYANLLADPKLTFHLKQGARADLPARAIHVRDPAERRCVLTEILRKLGRTGELEEHMRGRPLVEVQLEGGK